MSSYDIDNWWGWFIIIDDIKLKPSNVKIIKHTTRLLTIKSRPSLCDELDKLETNTNMDMNSIVSNNKVTNPIFYENPLDVIMKMDRSLVPDFSLSYYTIIPFTVCSIIGFTIHTMYNYVRKPSIPKNKK